MMFTVYETQKIKNFTICVSLAYYLPYNFIYGIFSTITFQCNSIASDSHYGVIDIIFWGLSRVHIDDFEVYRHTAESDSEHKESTYVWESWTI